MDIASPMLPVAEEYNDSTAFELDNTALTELVNFQKKNNPRLQGKTNRDIAEACGMSENTLCAILKGKNKNPRVATLVYIMRAVGGGSIDRLVGLAPHRDFAKEEAFYDATLVEAMQARLDEKRQRIDELTSELTTSEEECTRLRRMYNEKCMALSSAEAQLKSLRSDADGRSKTETEQRTDIEDLKRTLYRERDEMRKVRMLGILSCIGLIVALGIIIYLLWEMTNPTMGNFRY